MSDRTQSSMARDASFPNRLDRNVNLQKWKSNHAQRSM